jgi:CubicO group peptidase (beta-lactamase class C family)
LGLSSTYFETPETTNDYVTGYQVIDDGELFSLSGSNSNNSYAWAAGGIISNIHDLGRFADALFSGELLQPESYAEMFTFVPDSTKEGKYWGLSLAQVDAPAGQVYAATGESPGYEAKIIRLPDSNVTIIVQFNQFPTDPAAFDFIIENGLGLLEN